jgi:hypothetical protein
MLMALQILVHTRKMESLRSAERQENPKPLNDVKSKRENSSVALMVAAWGLTLKRTLNCICEIAVLGRVAGSIFTCTSTSCSIEEFTLMIGPLSALGKVALSHSNGHGHALSICGYTQVKDPTSAPLQVVD